MSYQQYLTPRLAEQRAPAGAAPNFGPYAYVSGAQRTTYTRGGWVFHRATQQQRRAFMACVPIACAFCDAIISPGATFTKHASHANRHGCFPACWICQPFDLVPARKQRSSTRRAEGAA